MLKCGQKDNKNYTFGIKKENIKEASNINVIYCSTCGATCKDNSKFCSACGEKF